MKNGEYVLFGERRTPRRWRLSITIRNLKLEIGNIEKMKNLLCIHPGECLLEDFIKPHEITQYRLAKDIGVSPMRIHEIVKGKRSITADTALRLGKYFGTTPQIWMRLQARYDLEKAELEVGKKIEHEVQELQNTG